MKTESDKIIEFVRKIGKFIINVVKLYMKNDLPIFAASASFFMIISSIPLFMIMLSTISLLPMIEMDDFVYNISLLFPHIPYMMHLVQYLISAAHSLSSSNVIYINLLVSLISGSTCLFSFIIGIRKVHNIKHTSNYIIIKFMTIVNILILYVSITLTIVFFIIGKFALGYTNIYIPFASDIISNILAYRYLTVGIVLMILSLSLYTCCTNFQRKYLKNIWGAIFTTVAWLAISNLFSVYYEHISIKTTIYESLVGTILAFMWLFICTNLVFIGACINEEVYPQKSLNSDKK